MRYLFSILFLIATVCLHAELVTVYDTKLYVERVGRGTPIIIVGGGPGFDHTYLRPHLDSLGIRNRLIYFDQRNTGRSVDVANPNTLTIAQYVDDIEGVRESLGLEKTIVLGHSWGGFLAMQYAAKYPSHVVALILVNPLPASSDGVKAFAAEVNRRLEPHTEILTRLTESSAFQEGQTATVEGYMRLVTTAYCSDPAKTRKLNLCFTPESNLKGQMVRARMTRALFVEPFDFHRDLEKISAPTLLIRGLDDPIAAPEMRKIEHAIPNVQYYEIAGSGHYPFVEQEEEFFDKVTTFLTNLELVGNSQ